MNLLSLVLIFHVCLAEENTEDFMKTTASLKLSVCLLSHNHTSVLAVWPSLSSPCFLLLVLYFQSDFSVLDYQPFWDLALRAVGASFQMSCIFILQETQLLPSLSLFVSFLLSVWAVCFSSFPSPIDSHILYRFVKPCLEAMLCLVILGCINAIDLTMSDVKWRSSRSSSVLPKMLFEKLHLLEWKSPLKVCESLH